MHKARATSFLLSFALIFSANAIPPPVPSAGVVERELEREFESQLIPFRKDIPAIQIDMPDDCLEMPEGRSVFIQRIEILGNTCVADQEILNAIGECLNCDLTLRDIYELCHIIDQYYAACGYFLARTYPPPQDIKNGILTLEVIEGCLGNIEVVGNCYYSECFIRSYFTALQNRPLRYDEFLRALMLVNDNSDLIVGSVFEKGEEFGCADVILRVSDARPVHLYLNANDYGRDLTTNTRGGGRLDYGNLFLYGDTLSIAEVVGLPVNALYFTDIRYTAPINRQGTYLGAGYLYSQFKIEELKNLRLRGRSDIATLRVDQALIRDRYLSVDLFTYFDFKQIENYVLGHRVSYDKLRVLTIGGFLDYFCPCFSHDYLTFSFSAGIPKFLGGLKAVDKQSSRIGGGGQFFIFNADYDRLQMLPQDTFLFFHASGQLSPSKLTLPEQFYIGGSDTVRGYPLAVALGDSGYYLNFEYRFPPPFFGNRSFFNTCALWKDVVQFDLFFDQGGVFLNRKEEFFRNSARNTFLCGTGLGIRVLGPYCLSLSVDMGIPLNHRDLTHGVFTYFKLTGQPF